MFRKPTIDCFISVTSNFITMETTLSRNSGCFPSGKFRLHFVELSEMEFSETFSSCQNLTENAGYKVGFGAIVQFPFSRKII